MSIILSDAGLHKHLLPLTFTRPVAQLRPGVLRLSEGWYVRSGLPVGYRTEPYLSEAFRLPTEAADFEVDGGLFPTEDLVAAVMNLRAGEVLVKEGRALAFGIQGQAIPSESDWSAPPAFLKRIEFVGELIRFERPWHVFQQCGRAIALDHALLTDGRRSQPLSGLNTVIGDPQHIFLEEGAVVEGCTLNTRGGPIYIGRNAEVMEGSLIRGPFALGDHAQVKMGAKIYGPSSFGPECRVGGEVNNSVLLGFSNKGHDGFLGNSVLGEWCNLGADTNNSNLKNTYGNVKVFSYASGFDEDSGLQFCGLIMGDHAKSGINTMFNTGTVVGVAANVFGGGFQPKHIPGFSWGGVEGIVVHDVERALRTARLVMERRHVQLTALDDAVLRHVFALEQAGIKVPH
ncbi:MAG: glucose-1-phosphate thymidylyltransferase [Flavobacteriales bacterium]|nr:glucose-1-phosphate thymidylyltransferase [Flavobacteriales bacterium]MCC6936605.1 glucose-1-phosphate thymidylyltransferase [Flavobacteriales bacterium]